MRHNKVFSCQKLEQWLSWYFPGCVSIYSDNFLSLFSIFNFIDDQEIFAEDCLDVQISSSYVVRFIVASVVLHRVVYVGF